MKYLKLLVLVAVIGGGYQYWNNKNKEAVPAPHGFYTVAMPDTSSPNTVLIMTPKNCPLESSQRAYKLAEQLTEAGIPNVQSHKMSISSPRFKDQAERKSFKQAIKNTNQVIRGDLPAVFINGFAKSNPSFKEVVSVYNEVVIK